MSNTVENFVTWKCDHCGRRTKGTHARPKGWRHLAIGVVIEDSTLKGASGKHWPAVCFQGDACKPCALKLRRAAMTMKKAWRAP